MICPTSFRTLILGSIVMSMSGCAAPDDGTVRASDGGVPPDAEAHDAQPSRLDVDAGSHARVDAAVPEAEPVPAVYALLDGVDLEVGDGFDRESGTRLPSCIGGVPELMRGGVATISTGDLDRYGAGLDTPGGLTPPSTEEASRVLDESDIGLAIGSGYARLQWGWRILGSLDPREDGPCQYVSSIEIGHLRYTAVRIVFESESEESAFLARHEQWGAELDDDAAVAAMERELAPVAVVRVYHLQVGGDRDRATALLENHRCSVTELRACVELHRALSAIRPIGDPTLDDLGDWALMRANLATL